MPTAVTDVTDFDELPIVWDLSPAFRWHVQGTFFEPPKNGMASQDAALPEGISRSTNLRGETSESPVDLKLTNSTQGIVE